MNVQGLPLTGSGMKNTPLVRRLACLVVAFLILQAVSALQSINVSLNLSRV